VADRGRQRGGAHLLVLLAAVVCVLPLLVGGAAAAPAAPDQQLIAAINGARSSTGNLQVLERAQDLDGVAQRHARAMARRGSIFHNPRLTDQIQGWDVVGENVGVGRDVQTLHRAFLTSPEHRANVLDVRYRELGIGIVRAEGKLWVAQVFRTPTGAVPDHVLVAGAQASAPPLEQAPAPKTVVVPTAPAPALPLVPSRPVPAAGPLVAALALVIGVLPRIEGGNRRSREVAVGARRAPPRAAGG
jgi:hypothetical protein